MKKVIAFVLAAVMCLGFVGCGEKGNSGRINADKVFEALSQEGELVLDTKHDNTESYNSAKVPNVEMIVFRMPKEQRMANSYQEWACYIEVYPSKEELEKSVGQYENDLFWLYSSGNVLLRIDGNVTSDAAAKYAETLKSVTKEEVSLRNSKNPTPKESKREKTFVPPNGFGANEAYEALKKEIGSIEFGMYSYSYNQKSEHIIFWDTADKADFISVTVNVRGSAEEASSYAKTMNEMNSKTNIKACVLVSGNIVLQFSSEDKNLFSEYSDALEKITGKSLDIENSRMPD